VPVLVYSAWYFGGEIDRVVKYARQTEHGILVAIAIGLAVVGVRAYRRHKRHQAVIRANRAAAAQDVAPPEITPRDARRIDGTR